MAFSILISTKYGGGGAGGVHAFRTKLLPGFPYFFFFFAILLTGLLKFARGGRRGGGGGINDAITWGPLYQPVFTSTVSFVDAYESIINAKHN